MDEKELRKMNRAELIEIIYALQQNEKALREENAELQKKLNDKTIAIENSGSIAEAALQLSGIFSAAQEAADTYLESLRIAGGQAEDIIQDARNQAAEILADVEKESAAAKLDIEAQRLRAQDAILSLFKNDKRL